MCEIGQKPLPLRSRPFFGSHPPQRIRDVRQRIRREPRSRARASSTGSPDRRIAGSPTDAPRAPDRRIAGSPTDAPRAPDRRIAGSPDRRSRRADRRLEMTYTPTGSPIQASGSRRLDHEQLDQDRGSWIKEMPSRHRARPTKQGARAPAAHDARDQDRGSRITYNEHRSRARGSRITGQAQSGQQISRTTGARSWRSPTSSYPGTLARIYQGRTSAARPTAQASPGELPSGKKRGLRRALS